MMRTGFIVLGLAAAVETTAFAYDRPSYQASPRVANPYDVAADGSVSLAELAAHLHGLLGEAEIAPPYVLVGHSLGGGTLLAFAKLYPDEVAGIVLVDGRLPGFTAACSAAGLGACVTPDEIQAILPPGMVAELNGAIATEGDAATAAELGDIPITLITATEPPETSPADPRLLAALDMTEEEFAQMFPEAEALRHGQALWMGGQSAYAQTAADGRYVEATGASHYVHREQPQLVIDEIERMLTRVRTGSWPD